MKKNNAFIFIFVIFSMIVGLLIACEETPSTPTKPDSGSKTITLPKEMQPSPSKSDKYLFLGFYKTVILCASACDAVYNPFADALSKKDFISAARIAKDSQSLLLTYRNNIKQIEIPDIKNEAAISEMKQGLMLVSDAYANKWMIMKEYIKLTKNPNSQVDIASDMKKYADDYETGIYTAAAKFYSAGAKLGINKNELTQFDNQK